MAYTKELQAENEMIYAQLAAAQQRVAELENLLGAARAHIANLSNTLDNTNRRVNEIAAAATLAANGSSWRVAHITDAQTMIGMIDAALAGDK